MLKTPMQTAKEASRWLNHPQRKPRHLYYLMGEPDKLLDYEHLLIELQRRRWRAK